MDLRSNLFGKGAARAPGLPGRPTPRPGGNDQMAPQGGYDGYGQRPQSGAGGGYGGQGGYGGGYGAEPKMPAYQQGPPSRGRQVRLRQAKVEDKTLQTQFIFG